MFKYQLKILLKNKAMLFWTLIFPFILGTLFYFTLSNTNSFDDKKIIPLGVINNEELNNNKLFKDMLNNLDDLFDIKYVTEEEAIKLLNDKEIDGYVLLLKGPKLVINQNGINQSIIKGVMDEYYQVSNTITNVIKYNPSLLNKILDNIEKDYVINDSKENVDFSLNYFLTLIAMTCLYGAFIGYEVIKNSEANLSKKGARICISPISKYKIILIGLFTGYIVQIITIILLYLYLNYVLNINFGNNILSNLFISFVGCLTGTSLGVFVGVSNKKGDDFKIGLSLAIIMFCCFLSGMMGGPGFKGIIDSKLPFIAKINPISIITDGLYAIYAYDNLNVYYECLFNLIIITLLLIISSFIFIRRKKYDSI